MSAMNSRTFSLFAVLVAFILSLPGCKKDDMVNETMAEVEKLATEINDTVNKAEDKKQGVADAQKLLDGKKDGLKSKMKEIGELRGFQVSDETMTKMGGSIADAVMKVEGLKLDLMSETMQDAELKTALDKLTKDFTDSLQP
jgi:outer membrane murein-binding lipoprotein Lpp